MKTSKSGSRQGAGGGENVAHASVKLTANSSDYRTQMKSAAMQMKELSSEYSLTATRARLTGSAMVLLPIFFDLKLL